MKLKYSPEDITKKQEILINTGKILKQEFVGIDEVIDSVMESLNTWFLFPELQERPVVVNLWGMTGVGKTALVSRLACLLDFEKRFFRYDMGRDTTEEKSLGRLLYKNMAENGAPYIIMLDEFQYAKTINEDSREIENSFSREVWDLLDSGKFQISRYIDREIEKMMTWKKVLNDCLEEGVEFNNGLVTKNEIIYYELVSGMEDDYFAQLQYEVGSNANVRNPRPIFTGDQYKMLYDYLPNSFRNIIEFKRRVKKLKGKEVIDLLTQVIESAKTNRLVDCTKTIVFIVGNLDEAYQMSGSFNPDINANDFYESSKQININHIKQALKARFRLEQISRLGNNHIIYPAFSEESFRKLIELELTKISNKIFDRFGIKLSFTKSFKRLIYREGVFPTQGTRPLFSTIYQLVNTKIPRLMAEEILHNAEADQINFDFKGDHMNYEYFKKGKSVYNYKEYVQYSMEKLRNPARGDMQAITAVHESGHAVISIKALKILPEYICSTSADVNSRGFALTKNKWKYFSRDEVIPRISELLGGIVAEKIIFGENKITRGAQEDIERATNLANRVIKDYGMGSLSATIHTADLRTKYSYHDNKGKYNREVRQLIEQAYAYTEDMLLSEKALLLQLSDYLSDERMISKDQIEKKVREFGSSELRNAEFIEDGDNLYYRNELKNQVCKIVEPAATEIKTSSQEIGEIIVSLNKQT